MSFSRAGGPSNSLPVFHGLVHIYKRPVSLKQRSEDISALLIVGGLFSRINRSASMEAFCRSSRSSGSSRDARRIVERIKSKSKPQALPRRQSNR